MMLLVSVHPIWADFDQVREEFEPCRCYDNSQCAQHKLRYLKVEKTHSLMTIFNKIAKMFR